MQKQSAVDSLGQKLKTKNSLYRYPSSRNALIVFSKLHKCMRSIGHLVNLWKPIHTSSYKLPITYTELQSDCNSCSIAYARKWWAHQPSGSSFPRNAYVAHYSQVAFLMKGTCGRTVFRSGNYTELLRDKWPWYLTDTVTAERRRILEAARASAQASSQSCVIL